MSYVRILLYFLLIEKKKFKFFVIPSYSMVINLTVLTTILIFKGLLVKVFLLFENRRLLNNKLIKGVAIVTNYLNYTLI